MLLAIGFWLLASSFWLFYKLKYAIVHSDASEANG